MTDLPREDDLARGWTAHRDVCPVRLAHAALDAVERLRGPTAVFGLCTRRGRQAWPRAQKEAKSWRVGS